MGEKAALRQEVGKLKSLVDYSFERVQATNPEAGIFEVVEELNRLVRSEWGPNRRRVQPPVLSPFPAGKALQYMLRRAIRPSVELARREIVEAAGGELELPFPNEEEAVAWIEREADVPQDPIPEDRMEQYRSLGETARQALDRQAELYGRWQHRAAEVWRPLEVVPYSAPRTGFPNRVPVPQDSALVPLARVTRMIAESTGFTAAKVTTHILADAPLQYDPVVVGERLLWERLPTGEQVEREEVVVTFRSPDLQFEDLRNIYRTIRRRWKAGKRLTEKEVILLRIIDDLEGPPGRKRQKAFWPKVQARMAEAGYPYKSSSAVSNAYQAAKKKLDRSVRISSAEADQGLPQGPSVRALPRTGGDPTRIDPETLRNEALRNQAGFRVFWSPSYDDSSGGVADPPWFRGSVVTIW